MVCVTYRFPTDKKIHYTGRAYTISKRDQQPFFLEETRVPMHNLYLQPAWFGTGRAN